MIRGKYYTFAGSASQTHCGENGLDMWLDTYSPLMMTLICLHGFSSHASGIKSPNFNLTELLDLSTTQGFSI